MPNNPQESRPLTREDLQKKKPTEETGMDTRLAHAIQLFKERPLSPESLTEYWQTRWKVYGEKANLHIIVPPCDRTQEEIEQLRQEQRKLVYVPQDVLLSPQGLVLLKTMHSHLGKKGRYFANTTDVPGWVDIEETTSPPNTNTTEPELLEQLQRQGKIGQRLATYIVGSYDSKDLTGKFFDDATHATSRLAGTKNPQKDILIGTFQPTGSIDIFSLLPTLSTPLLGGRSEGIKKH